MWCILLCAHVRVCERASAFHVFLCKIQGAVVFQPLHHVMQALHHLLIGSVLGGARRRWVQEGAAGPALLGKRHVTSQLASICGFFQVMPEFVPHRSRRGQGDAGPLVPGRQHRLSVPLPLVRHIKHQAGGLHPTGGTTIICFCGGPPQSGMHYV